MINAKSIVLALCGGTGVFTFCRWLTASGARILAYHGVEDRTEPLLNFDGFHVRPETFECHLRTLGGHYHVLSLGELVTFFQRGENPPKCAVAITFDDGYRNNLVHAAPLLRKYGMKATFFVTTGFVDGTHQPWWFRLRAHVAKSQGSDAEKRTEIINTESKLKRLPAAARDDLLEELGVAAALPYPMLDWPDVKELAGAGHEIGAHTVTHISMGHETAGVVACEIRDSIGRMEQMTGLRPKLYSYPYGENDHQNEAIARLVREAGCIGGVTTVEGFNQPGSDPLALKRINITGNHGRDAFRACVSGLSGMRP